MMPPPAVILGTPVVHAEGGTTGVSGIQKNKGCCPVITGADDEGDTARSSALSRNKPGNDAPSRRHSRHPSRPRRRRDDWGVGNPEEQRVLSRYYWCR